MADLPAVTRDGRCLEIGANIGTAQEAPAAFIHGAEGVGLFRTEMLFMDRDKAPDEQEQFEAYQQVLMNADNHPVIFRTMDIGGDKKSAISISHRKKTHSLAIAPCEFIQSSPSYSLFNYALFCVLPPWAMLV